jgi:hypothetical protein
MSKISKWVVGKRTTDKKCAAVDFVTIETEKKHLGKYGLNSTRCIGLVERGISDIPESEFKRNAALVASAPELYAMVQEYMLSDNDADRRTRAQALLRKAGGR